MSTTAPRLTDAQVERYHLDGYLQPIQIIDERTASCLRVAVDEHIAGLVPTERYELTDDIKVGAVQHADGSITYEYLDEQPAEPHTLPFLFNVWRLDQRFEEVAMSQRIASMARRLLGCEEVLLMEDNVVAKAPGAGRVPWHQDLGYWPVAEAAVVTVWIALDDSDAGNGAMSVVPRSHRTVEHLPVQFRDAAPFMGEYRPDVPTLDQDLESRGHEIVTYRMRPGEGGFHHPLLWHGSPPNETAEMRRAYVLRYLASGTTWLGASRVPYEDVGCPIGERVTGAHLPAVPTVR